MIISTNQRASAEGSAAAGVDVFYLCHRFTVDEDSVRIVFGIQQHDCALNLHDTMTTLRQRSTQSVHFSPNEMLYRFMLISPEMDCFTATAVKQEDSVLPELAAEQWGSVRPPAGYRLLPPPPGCPDDTPTAHRAHLHGHKTAHREKGGSVYTVRS